MYRSKCLTRLSLLCSSHVKLGCNSKRRITTLPPTWAKQFKILFLGRDEFSCLVLQQLYAAQDVWYNISIATNPDEKVDRGSRLSVSPLKTLAHSLNLPVHEIPHAKSDFKHWNPPSLFSELNGLPPPTDHLIVTASFGRILPLKMLKLFPENRRLNVHPSLLPAYRGAAPIQHTLLNGEKETGVCVIEMLKRARGIDTGAIWGSSKMAIRDGMTFHTLRDELAVEGGKILVSVLREMIDGKAVSTPQAENVDAPLAPTITFKDCTLDFTTMSADSIVRRYNAISHQRPLTSYLQTIKTLQIHNPYVHTSPPVFTPTVPGRACYSKPDKALLIRCANDSVLCVPKVKQEGKTLLDAKDWWNGAKSLGLVIKNEINFDSQDDVDQWLQPDFVP